MTSRCHIISCTQAAAAHVLSGDSGERARDVYRLRFGEVALVHEMIGFGGMAIRRSVQRQRELISHYRSPYVLDRIHFCLLCRDAPTISQGGHQLNNKSICVPACLLRVAASGADCRASDSLSLSLAGRWS